jgi:hypothetical protein
MKYPLKTKLSRNLVRFDPDSPEHLRKYFNFQSYRRWGSFGCPFELEYPYETIEEMIKTKLSQKVLHQCLQKIL